MNWKFKGECEPLPNDGSSQFQIWDDGRIIAVVVSTEDKSVGVTEGIKNAKLIEMAPELLKTCQRIREQLLDQGWVNAAEGALLDSVIAKAEGQHG